MSNIITLPPIKTPGILPLVRPFPRPVIHDKSLVAYWVFDREGKLMDLSGKGNHGTISGATWTAEGRYGSALSLDGIDNFVNCGNSSTLNIGLGSYSITTWINPTDLDLDITYDEMLFEKRLNTDNRFYFRLRKSNFIQFYSVVATVVYDSQKTGLSPALTKGVWNFLVLIINRTDDRLDIYINGAFAGSGDALGAAGVNISNTGNSIIGAGTIGTANFQKGIMDYMMIFNKALTAIEVRNLYKAGL